MFIQTEDTPNAATMKFLPSQAVVSNPVDFATVEEAVSSPLAQVLFAVDGVQSVFLGTDFVSVTRTQDIDWPVLRPAVLSVIMEHFEAERPVLNEIQEEALEVTAKPEDGDVVTQIKDLLDNRIRPAVAQDGGDVAFERYEDGIVYLRLKGACAGCPSATATLKYGIENMLRYFIPEVQEVRRVE